jgi:hypothetical protein
MARDLLLGDIIEKFAFDAERSPRERDLDFAFDCGSCR